MNAMTITRGAGPMTRAELDALPDDGYRHELIDGVLVVSPSPRFRHQQMSGELFFLLRRSVPEGLVVFSAPFDVALADDTVVIPDLIVAPRAEFTAKDLPVAPLLAVEILSPSTRRFDLSLKHSRFEAAGIASYWVLDPDEPSLTAWELHDNAYEQVAHVNGDESWTAERPFPVTIVPNQLVD